MSQHTRQQVEEEIISATRHVLRCMGRVGALTGNASAAIAAEVLIGLVDGAVAASRQRSPPIEVVVRPREGDADARPASPPPFIVDA